MRSRLFCNVALPADLGLENFPNVDAVLAGLAGVANHNAPLKLVQVHAQFNAMFAAGREFDGPRAPPKAGG